ncbi:MAG: hypothetical protein AAB250_19390, partial [Bdellovibrionota bacterium]
PSFEDHGRLALDSEYAKWFRDNLIQIDPNAQSYSETVSDIEYEIVNQSSLSGKAPLYFVRATSKNVHQLSCGISNLSKKPHPFR